METNGPAEFRPPAGAILLLVEEDETVAGGALRGWADGVGEIQHLWTAVAARGDRALPRRGLRPDSRRRQLREADDFAAGFFAAGFLAFGLGAFGRPFDARRFFAASRSSVSESSTISPNASRSCIAS